MQTLTKPRKILIYGLDPVLLDTRRRILERVGFEVQVALGRDEFQGCTTEAGYDLLIICHTIPESEQRQLSLAEDPKRPHVLQVTRLVPPDTFLRQVHQQLH